MVIFYRRKDESEKCAIRQIGMVKRYSQRVDHPADYHFGTKRAT